ncbi:MAG TPA: cytochrome c [Beijerinckiaceae bacterium]|nr:cytochrome c [Beijerinckiaceae bacterium]
MKRMIIAAAVLTLGVTAGIAQGDPIAARKAMMKEVGGAMGPMAAMNKGERPFDLATAKASLGTMNKASKAFGPLFPATAKSGGESTADEKIWSDAAGWNAALKKFETDTAAAVAAVKDEASFKAEFGKVAANCGGCHNTYRIKK